MTSKKKRLAPCAVFSELKGLDFLVTKMRQLYTSIQVHENTEIQNMVAWDMALYGYIHKRDARAISLLPYFTI